MRGGRSAPALIVVALACALCGCQSAHQRTADADRADSLEFADNPAVTPPSVQTAQVETTLVNFSNALASGDRDTLVALAGDGFTRIEDGRTYDREQMIAAAQQALEDGSTIRTAVDFDVQLVGPVAWTRYHVVGELRTPDKRRLISLLETAVLERREGSWRVMQMTSMPEVVK